MANGIRTGDSHGFNKGHSSKFHVGSQVQQTPEEGQRIYQPKHRGNNNKDEDKGERCEINLKSGRGLELFIWPWYIGALTNSCYF